MEATFNEPWMRRRTVPLPQDMARLASAPQPSFDRWFVALRHLGRFEGALRARLLILFLSTVAGFAITTIGGAALTRFVAPASWVLTSVAELVLIVGLVGFLGKAGRETGTLGWGGLAVGAFLLSMAGGTAYSLARFVDADLAFVVAGRSVGAEWALLVAHLALGVGLLASVKILTTTARVLRARVALTHARSARLLLAIAIGAVVGTHIIHLFGSPPPEVTAGSIYVALTLALVAGARMVGAVCHLREAIDDALDAGEMGMPERWFARPSYA